MQAKVLAALGAAWMLTTAGEARAGDLEPYMWGIGVNLGTVVVPGQYPLSFPSKINNYNFIEQGPRAGNENGNDPNRDLDADGKPRFTSLERVKGDVRFGVDGFYGIDKDNRVGASAGLATGGGYSDMFFLLHYDRVLVVEKPFLVMGGLGVGAGSMTFKGHDDTIQGYQNELLKVPYFPLKARLSGQFHTDTISLGPTAFVQVGIPSNHFYTDLDGKDQALSSPFNFVNYLAGGIQFDFQYGDFKPPKKKKPGGKKPPPKGGNKGGGGAKGGSGGNKGGGGTKRPTHP